MSKGPVGNDLKKLAVQKRQLWEGPARKVPRKQLAKWREGKTSAVSAESTVPGGPIGGQTRVTLRNEHMQYIITW